MDFRVDWIVLFVVTAVPFGAFAWAAVRAWRKRSPEAWGWIAVALAGLPALAFGFLYLIAIPIAVIVVVLSAILSRWKALDHAAPVMTALLSLSLAAPAMADERGTSALLAWAFVASILAAIFAVAKLGRMVGIGVLYEPNLNRAEPPVAPILPV